VHGKGLTRQVEPWPRPRANGRICPETDLRFRHMEGGRGLESGNSPGLRLAEVSCRSQMFGATWRRPHFAVGSCAAAGSKCVARKVRTRTSASSAAASLIRSSGRTLGGPAATARHRRRGGRPDKLSSRSARCPAGHAAPCCGSVQPGSTAGPISPSPRSRNRSGFATRAI